MKTTKTTFNYVTLFTLLTASFAFNLTKIKCLTQTILALIEARSVNLARIAGFSNSKVIPPPTIEDYSALSSKLLFLLIT